MPDHNSHRSPWVSSRPDHKSREVKNLLLLCSLQALVTDGPDMVSGDVPTVVSEQMLRINQVASQLPVPERIWLHAGAMIVRLLPLVETLLDLILHFRR